MGWVWGFDGGVGLQERHLYSYTNFKLNRAAALHCYLVANGNNLCSKHINWLDEVGRSDWVVSKNTGDIFCSGDRSYSSNNIPRAQISDAEFQYQWNVHLSSLGFSETMICLLKIN